MTPKLSFKYRKAFTIDNATLPIIDSGTALCVFCINLSMHDISLIHDCIDASLGISAIDRFSRNRRNIATIYTVFGRKFEFAPSRRATFVDEN
uniref:Uncharacterized protein n=1 Tax=Romanomermis culicivorax TaxID=13658 RepID=A0A915HZG1_ROMCU